MTASRDAPIVSDANIARYQRDGAICLRQVFDLRWLESLAHGFELNMASPGPNASCLTPEGGPGGYFDDFCNWDRFDEYRDFVFHSPAGAIAGQLMQSRHARLFLENMLIKEPGTLEITPWHQDLPYYCVAGRQVCSIWLPLDPVPIEAAVEFVAGSHAWGKMFTPRKFIDGQEYSYTPGTFEPVPDIDGERASYEILSWPVEPGDCIVFHMLSLHGAPGTAGLKARRRAFSTRWLGDDAVYAVRPGRMFPLLPDLGLRPGDPMDRPIFPLVWQAGGG